VSGLMTSPFNSSLYAMGTSIRTYMGTATENAAPGQGATSAPNSPRTGPADRVDLSDHAKAVLARASTEQVAARKLEAQINLFRSSKAGAPPSNSKAPSDPKTVSFDDLAGASSGGDAGSASVTAPKVNFSGSLQAGGFTISASGNASTWSSEIRIEGPNGAEFKDVVFGGGEGMGVAEWSGSSNLGGMQLSASKENGKEYITLSGSSSVAAIAATPDSLQGVSTAQTNSTTFVVDFDTGSISAVQAATASTTQLTVR